MKNQLFILLILITSLAKSQSQGPFAGSVTMNVPIVGSKSTTINGNNVFTSNNVYGSNTTNLANAGNYSDYLFITGFGFSIPPSSIILGIEVNIERSDLKGKCKDKTVSLLKGGVIVGNNKALSPAWPMSDANQVYGSDSDLWGTTWTAANINSPSFGLAFSWERSGGGALLAFARIDLITIKVEDTAPVTLPIELISFNAECLNGNGVIKWSTATQTNNDYFTIEKSDNAIIFEPLEIVKGEGNSMVKNNYSIIDKNPFINEPTYYRLKQTDYDGSYTYSNIINIECTQPNIEMSIYPNPFSTQTTISFSKEQNNTPINIIDPLGKVVKTLYLTGRQLLFEKEDFKSGIYFIQTTDEMNNVIVKKIFIQ